MAFRKWEVQYADFGGVYYPTIHTQEIRAKKEAENYLRRLLKHVREHATIEARVGRNEKYVKAAEKVINEVMDLLDQGRVWAAYHAYKKFEKAWDKHFRPFSLMMSVGSMRVVPDPESEA